ncbi:MAG: DNA polymerase [Verrucomicrobiales bacterium]
MAFPPSVWRNGSALIARRRPASSRYFKQYPGVQRYMEETVTRARERGYVETMTGRRRYLRDINSRNGMTRSGAERTAINTPIQGSAADMIKIAMTRVQNALREGHYRSRLILQVHDELVFDLHHEEQDSLPPLVVDCMRDALPLSVPVVVDTGTGTTGSQRTEERLDRRRGSPTQQQQHSGGNRQNGGRISNWPRLILKTATAPIRMR